MRKNSRSLRKSSSQKQTRKKDTVKKLAAKEISPLNIQNSLYRKYSNTQSYHYMCGVSIYLKEEKSTNLAK